MESVTVCVEHTSHQALFFGCSHKDNVVRH